jgi:hypothetical protein
LAESAFSQRIFTVFRIACNTNHLSGRYHKAPAFEQCRISFIFSFPHIFPPLSADARTSILRSAYLALFSALSSQILLCLLSIPAIAAPALFF